MDMFELIDKNLDYLTHLTKDEAELIADVLTWDEKQRFAFMHAKKIFEGRFEKTKLKNCMKKDKRSLL